MPADDRPRPLPDPGPGPLRVLVAAARPAQARAHRLLVDRVPGFRVVGVAGDGRGVLERVARGGVDLVLLDLALPGRSGVGVCRALHQLGGAPDVLVTTAVRDRAAVRAAVRSGAVDVLITPLRPEVLRGRLDAYAAYRSAVTDARPLADQREVDALLATLRPSPAGTRRRAGPSRGAARESLERIRTALTTAPDGLTAQDAATATGLSRVAARRYLEHLVDQGTCSRSPRYGGAGRPPVRYVRADAAPG